MLRIAFITSTLFVMFFLLFAVFDARQKEDILQSISHAIEQEDWFEAEKLFKKNLAAEIDMENSWAAWLLFIDMSRKSALHPDVLLSYLDDMLKDYGQDPIKKKFILHEIAVVTERQNVFTKSLAAWEKYARLRSLSVEEAYKVYLILIRMYYDKGDFAAVQETLNDCIALQIEPEKSAYCKYALADIYANKGDFVVATEYITSALEADISAYEKAQFYFLYADILEFQRKNKEALEYFTMAQEHYGNQAVVQNRIAHLKKILKIK